jgi:iron(III) transport system ATP-binding protein
VADFIGDANLIDVEARSIDGDSAEIRIGPVILRLPRRGIPTGPAKIAVRPESLIFGPSEQNRPALSGMVAKAAYLGTHMEYTVATEHGDLFVIDREVLRPRSVGARVVLTFADHGVVLVQS